MRVAAAYYRIEDGRLVLTHTEVPVEFSGQGIATRLAQGTLELLRQVGSQGRSEVPFHGEIFRQGIPNIPMCVDG